MNEDIKYNILNDDFNDFKSLDDMDIAPDSNFLESLNPELEQQNKELNKQKIIKKATIYAGIALVSGLIIWLFIYNSSNNDSVEHIIQEKHSSAPLVNESAEDQSSEKKIEQNTLDKSVLNGTEDVSSSSVNSSNEDKKRTTLNEQDEKDIGSSIVSKNENNKESHKINKSTDSSLSINNSAVNNQENKEKSVEEVQKSTEEDDDKGSFYDQATQEESSSERKIFETNKEAKQREKQNGN